MMVWCRFRRYAFRRLAPTEPKTALGQYIDVQRTTTVAEPIHKQQRLWRVIHRRYFEPIIVLDLRRTRPMERCTNTPSS